MSKVPFEKIRSLVERKKLFQQVIQEKGEIVCKGNDESLFQFMPETLSDEGIIVGDLIIVEKLPVKDIAAVGNFAVGTEKYFLSGSLKVHGDKGFLNASCDVFQLQRRATLRLSLRPQVGLFMAITEFQQKPLYLIAHVADISAGGARVYFGETHSAHGITGPSKDPGLKPGTRFKAVIHPPSGKNLEVTCDVRHSQKAVANDQMVEQFGVEFVELDVRVKNRLLAMTMDLQQKLIQKVE